MIEGISEIARSEMEIFLRELCACVETAALCLCMCLWVRTLTELKQVLGAISILMVRLAQRNISVGECTTRFDNREVDDLTKDNCIERRQDGNRGRGGVVEGQGEVG